MKTSIALYLAACLAVSGCTAYRPDATQQAQLKIGAKQWNAQPPTSERLIALQTWWDGFDDVVLAKLLGAAQQASPSVWVAEARINEARAEARAVGAALWPQVTGNAGYERWHAKSKFFASGSDSHVYSGVDFAWEIDLWGEVASERRASQARTRVREIEWHDARTSLAAEVANAYLSLRASQMRQRLEENSRTSLLKSARMLRSLEHVGLASANEADLLDASAAQSQSRWLLATAETDVLFKVLVELTDMDEQALRDLVGPVQPELPYPRAFTVNALPAEVLNQRPDVRIAAQQVTAALEGINASQARRYPALSLLGSIGGTRSSGGVTLSNSSWSFGPSVSIPLFTGGRLTAEVEQNKARYNQALGQYQRTVRAAVREVEATMVRLDVGRPSESSLREAVAKYQSQFHAGEARLKVGTINVIEFEVLRRSLIDSQLRLLDQQREQLANWIILYKAVGGQWVPYDASQS